MAARSDTGRLLSRQKARAFLGIGVTTLWKLESEGRVSAIRIGRRVLFPIEDLRRFVAACRRDARRQVPPAKPDAPAAGRPRAPTS